MDERATEYLETILKPTGTMFNQLSSFFSTQCLFPLLQDTERDPSIPSG